MSDNNGIRWEDPPPARRWGTVVDALRARPGQWAVVATVDTLARASSLAQMFRKKSGIESVQRKVGDEWRVYARAASSSAAGRFAS